MQIFDNPEIQPPQYERGVGLGFFDGVHRGHLELVRTLVFECRRDNLVSAVFTFPRHPESVLHPDAPFDSYLGDLASRLELLAACGLAETHLREFDAAFAAVEPLEFLERTIFERLQARLIVVGHDYRFGRHGTGDVNLLKKWADGRGIRVIVVDEVNMYGERISSSRIRSLISEGDMVMAASLLGRPYSLGGMVIAGRQLGRRLGFPTANLTVDPELACPAFGVYATRTRVNGRTYQSITNIGLRPTVDLAGKHPLVETFLYDTDLSLYDQTIQVDFLQMIRPERQFEDVSQLGRQVSEDMDIVRAWHASSEQCYEKARVADIPVYLVPTSRFAQASLHIVFEVPLEKRRASCLAVLMRTLTASCRRYPSRTSLAAALDSLYGASIEANLEKQGDLQVISLSADGLMRWTDGSSPFRETCGLIFDLLLEPLLGEDGLFDKATMETERQNLILELAARENDRSKYSYDRCLAIFCGSQVQGLSPIGDRRFLEEITLEEMKLAYEDLLKSTAISVYLGGQIDELTLQTCLDGLRRLPAATRPVFRPAAFPAPVVPAGPTGLVEHKSVEQARVALAYSGLPPYFSHRSIIATVLNSMLGGDVQSLLFDVVREKMGLAYSVFSMNQRSISALFVLAGVAADQVSPALMAIRSQVAALAAGEFDRSLFDRSRQMLETSILSATDDLSTMVAQQMIGRVYGRSMTRDESLSLLHSVTPDDIVEMAGQLRLATCYVLTGPGQQPDLSVSGLPEGSIINNGGQP